MSKNIGELCLEVYDEVRAAFKGTLKSNNKSYKSGGELKEKARRELRNRNRRTIFTTNCLENLRKMNKFNNSYLYGQIVLAQKRSEMCGSCLEMTAAAVFLAVNREIGEVWEIHVRKPGDHGFCIVGSRGSQLPDSKNLADLTNNLKDADQLDKFFVIDPWFGISCNFRDYHQKCLEKLKKWWGVGKCIDDIFSREIKLASPEYLKNLFSGKLSHRKSLSRENELFLHELFVQIITDCDFEKVQNILQRNPEMSLYYNPDRDRTLGEHVDRYIVALNIPYRGIYELFGQMSMQQQIGFLMRKYSLQRLVRACDSTAEIKSAVAEISELDAGMSTWHQQMHLMSTLKAKIDKYRIPAMSASLEARISLFRKIESKSSPTDQEREELIMEDCFSVSSSCSHSLT